MSEPKRTPWQLRALRLCPLAVALLWVAGIAHVRALHLSPAEWAVVVASGFVIQTLTRRFARPRPLPPLPEGAQPAVLAALAAAIVAVLAAAIGGVAESIVQRMQPSDAPWALRTGWHAACAFAASYCAFLERLLRSPTAGRKR